jgi:hypothetical protein
MSEPSGYSYSIEGHLLGYPHIATGATLYAIAFDTRGCVWDEANDDWTTYATADIANYAIAMTEQGTASQYYVLSLTGSSPTTWNTGWVYEGSSRASVSPTRRVYLHVFVQAGANPAEGDALVCSDEILMGGGMGGWACIRPQGETNADGLHLAERAIDSSKFDNTTAFPLRRHDNGMLRQVRVRGRLIASKRAVKPNGSQVN